MHIAWSISDVGGIQDAVIERLFRAHFTENRSLFDRDSLAALGTEAGLADVQGFPSRQRS